MAHLPSGTESMRIRFGGRLGGDRRRARPPVVRADPARPAPGPDAPADPSEPLEKLRPGGLSRRIAELNHVLALQARDAHRIANAVTKEEGGAATAEPDPVPIPDPDPVPIPDPDPDPVPIPGPDPIPERDIAAFAHAAAVLTLAIGGRGGASDALEGEWFKKAKFPDTGAIALASKEEFAVRLGTALKRMPAKQRSALMTGIKPSGLLFLYDAALIAHGGVLASRKD